MYRPRYCRECGQRIERERWRSWHSDGFCDHCAPRFYWLWVGRSLALIALGGLVGFGLGNWAAVRQSTPAPPLQIESELATLQPEWRLSSGQEQSQEFLPPGPSENHPQLSKSLEGSSAPSSSTAISYSKSKTAPVSLCGAPTKSGKPCRRRVKGGGRCYQHRQK